MNLCKLLFLLTILLVPKSFATGKYCILFGKCYDPKTDVVWEKKYLCVSEGKITGIEAQPPKNIVIKNYESLFFIPGLIDLHTHLLLEDRAFGENFSQTLQDQVEKRLKSKSQSIELAQSRMKQLLAHGFTSVRDVGNSGLFWDVELKKRIMHSKNYPNLFISGQGISFNRGQFVSSVPMNFVEQEYFIWKKNVPAIDQLTIFHKHEVDLLKIYADDDPAPTSASLEELKKLVGAASDMNLPVAAHAITASAIKNAIDAGVHTLEHGLDMKPEWVALMKKKEITLVATDYYRTLREYFPQKKLMGAHFWEKKACERLKMVIQSGGKVAFGSDNFFEFQKVGKYAEFSLDMLIGYGECGMDPKQIIQASTSHAAAALRRSDLGQITIGARADIVGLAADPLVNIQALKATKIIIKDGVLIKR